MQPIFHNFLAVKPQGKYDSRSAGKLATLFYGRELSHFDISYCGPHLWNELIHYKAILTI